MFSLRNRQEGRFVLSKMLSFWLKLKNNTTLNDMFIHFERLGYLDFYTLIKQSVILPHGVCKITRTF
jgi:hypothetical protein